MNGPGRTGDRLALRALVDDYAHHVDGRDFLAVAALFTEDGVLVAPAGERRGPSAIAAALNALTRYERTLHVLGQQRIAFDTASEDQAAADTPCMAHHLLAADADGPRRDRTLALRYHDRYRRGDDGVWRIEHRRLDVGWTTITAVVPAP